jgi:hypothetical protein
MPDARRKISAVYIDFIKEIKRLERLNRQNQTRFAISGGAIGISKRQLYLLSEGLFFAGFRAYENFLRDIFLLYCLEKRPRSGHEVKSFLKPKDFLHAEDLIRSAMPFLDWSSPSNMITRAETYLDQGFPIKLPLSTNQEVLNDYRHIRNHIAHNSRESLGEYKKVVRKHFNTLPLIIPSPGEFLLVKDKQYPSKYKLLVFLDFLKKISNDLT